MRGLALAAAVLSFEVLCGSASAETFVSAYAPRLGERAFIELEKCRSEGAGQDLEQRCVRSRYLEVVLAPARSGAARISYELQAMTLPDGQDLDGLALREARLAMTIIFEVDEGGAPVRVENRAEVTEAMFAALVRLEGANQDAETLRRARAMYEGMDDAGFAQVIGRDLASLSIFQGIDAEVGVPVTGQLEVPFPLDPNQVVLSNAQLLVSEINRNAGIARAVYTQVTDELSMANVLRSFLQGVPAAQRPDLSNVRVVVRDEAHGVIDLASGRTREVIYTRRAEIVTGETQQVRLERITVRRRML